MRSIVGRVDRVLTNLTLLNSGRGRIPDAAFAITEGQIVATGSAAEIDSLAWPGTVIEDLSGATVVPGLIDAHNHLLMTGQILQQVQLYDCRSIDDILDRVKAGLDGKPPGTWIIGRGWDESLLADGRHPTRHDLDRVSPDHPVVIHRVWNRLVANSRALELAGITRETPDPPVDQPYAGGFERDANGHPTGLFRDRAKDLITSAVPALDQDQLISAIETACREYNRLGITTVSEPGLTPEQVRAFAIAHERGTLSVRTAMSIAGWGFGSAQDDATIYDRLDSFGVIGGFGDDVLWFDGVKLMPDGGVGDRTARMYQPYQNEPENFGAWTLDPGQLVEHIKWSHDNGFAMDVRTCGDEGQEVTVQAMAQAQTVNPNRLRHRVHHAYLPTAVTLDLMAKHQISAVVSNPFLWSLGESYVTSIGIERASRMMPMRTYLNRGIPLAGSSDSPVASYNPWIGIATAMTRTTVKGTMLGESECLTLDEALRMYTSGGAFALNRAPSLGLIGPGRPADLVVLAADPAELEPDEIMNITPTATMLNGTWVHDNR